MPTTKKHKYSEEDLAKAIAGSPSQSEAMRKLGITVTGGNHRHIARRVKAAKLDTSHFTRKGNPLLGQNKKSPEELLIRLPEGANRTHSYLLARALRETGVPYACKFCGITDAWKGKKLVLQVDHTDGDGMNNLPTNLRFLCPNCHSQTENYAGRKNNQPERKRLSRQHPCPTCGAPRFTKTRATSCRLCVAHPTKIAWPTDKELLAMLAVSNYLQVGKRLGVSDNAVRKHLRKHAVVS
jgi:predicted RNA-binding Zn-ribbon protein involved in translation (DUF1610 family)